MDSLDKIDCNDKELLELLGIYDDTLSDEKYMTIKEIAYELKLTKQAIHQKRKQKEYVNILKPHTKIKSGIVYLSPTGIEILKESFNKNKIVTDNKNDQLNILKSLINIIEKDIDIKDTQLQILDRQLIENEKNDNQLNILKNICQILEKDLQNKDNQIKLMNEQFMETNKYIQFLQSNNTKLLEENISLNKKLDEIRTVKSKSSLFSK